MPETKYEVQKGVRWLTLNTPLGPDQLLPTALDGEESLSSLFQFRVAMISPRPRIKPEEMLGKSVTIKLQRAQGELRMINGLVRFFAGGQHIGRGHRAYTMEVVPTLWLLTRTADCRIFQDQTTMEIVKTLLEDAGVKDYETKGVSGNQPKRPYCVQYRETDFAFLSRLLEEDGIHYYFRHEENRHVLVFGNKNSSFTDCADAKVMFQPARNYRYQVFEWQTAWAFQPGKWVQRDFNFETPSADLTTRSTSVLPVAAFKAHEMFDYPGVYPNKSEGGDDTKLQMETTEAEYEQTEGQADIPSFFAGGKFAFENEPTDEEKGKTFVITRVEHHAVEPTYLDTGDGAVASYTNRFTCIPSTVPFRPQRRTAKPQVGGPQTAFVVGPSGEEIFTDKYGRVKVQFHWDRLGKKDDKSSCWLRCVQPWSGKQWGDIVLPRIGMEVVVDFIDGDIDRPMVIGCVYNAEAMPPYGLPANATQSGRKSRSSKGGGEANFNELRFEDKKGSEQVYLHAEKDMERIVENDDTLKVGNNQTETIEKGNRKCTIEMGNDTLTLKMGNQSTKLDLGKSTHEAMQSIELIVGQSSVKVDQMGVTIKGMMIKIDGMVMTDVKGLMTTVKGDAMLIVKGGITMIN